MRNATVAAVLEREIAERHSADRCVVSGNVIANARRAFTAGYANERDVLTNSFEVALGDAGLHEDDRAVHFAFTDQRTEYGRVGHLVENGSNAKFLAAAHHAGHDRSHDRKMEPFVSAADIEDRKLSDGMSCLDGATSFRAAANERRRVADGSHCFTNLVGGLRADTAGVVDHARHGRHRHTSPLCYSDDRHKIPAQNSSDNILLK